MSMSKSEQQEARRRLGQMDATIGQDLVGRAIQGSLDYFGVPGEFRLTTDATPAEILHPGFLDPATKENKSYLGAIIHVVAKSGSADPQNWSLGTIMIVAVRGMRITDETGEEVRNDKGRLTFHDMTKVGLINHFNKPTVVDDRTHDMPNGKDTGNKTRRRLNG